MAFRNLRYDGDEILRKISRPIKEVNHKIIELLDDMAETMYSFEGVGLAAPQIGVLKRAVVIDVGDGLIELINPEIVEKEGEQEEDEGCLSLPGMLGTVKRPTYVKVKALNREGEVVFVEGENLKAVALCHELDHLNGILYKDLALENTFRERETRRSEEECS